MARFNRVNSAVGLTNLRNHPGYQRLGSPSIEPGRRGRFSLQRAAFFEAQESLLVAFRPLFGVQSSPNVLVERDGRDLKALLAHVAHVRAAGHATRPPQGPTQHAPECFGPPGRPKRCGSCKKTVLHRHEGLHDKHLSSKLATSQRSGLELQSLPKLANHREHILTALSQPRWPSPGLSLLLVEVLNVHHLLLRLLVPRESAF